MEQTEYNYESSGFSPFLTRPLGSERGIRNASIRQVNFDQNQITGSLGDSLQIGNILINGAEGNITVSDGENVRVLIGYLQD